MMIWRSDPRAAARESRRRTRMAELRLAGFAPRWRSLEGAPARKRPSEPSRRVKAARQPPTRADREAEKILAAYRKSEELREKAERGEEREEEPDQEPVPLPSTGDPEADAILAAGRKAGVF